METVASYYYLGQFGVEQSNEKALPYFQMAAEKGSLSSQLALGWIYYFEQGSEKSEEKSAYYFKLAADQGNVVAMEMTALFFYSERSSGLRSDF